MYWNSLVSDVRACKWFVENTVSVNKETVKSKGTTIRNFVFKSWEAKFIYKLSETFFFFFLFKEQVLSEETTQQEAGESRVKASEDKCSGFYFSTFSF